MTDQMRHEGHDVVAFNEAFDTENPKVHEGIAWCHDCEVDFVPRRRGDER